MQILHRLFKVAHAQDGRNNSSPTIKENTKDKESKHEDIVPYKSQRHHHRSERTKEKKFGSKNFTPFVFLCREDIATACFYSTLNLRRVNNFHSRENWQKMKKEDMAKEIVTNSSKVDSAAQYGKKVLPLSDSNSSSTTSPNDQSGTLEKKDLKVKGDKTKNMSKMKELLRWAAAAKAEKGRKFIGRKVLHFRNKAALKAVPDDDQMSNESPKISFNWEVESCSTTTSSAYSSVSIATSCKNDQTLVKGLSPSFIPAPDRKGNWITTDSEFVVLEL